MLLFNSPVVAITDVQVSAWDGTEYVCLMYASGDFSVHTDVEEASDLAGNAEVISLEEYATRHEAAWIAARSARREAKALR
jgi:hypothetical protein